MAHRESRQKRKARQRPAGAPRYEVRGRVWIDGLEGTFLGSGGGGTRITPEGWRAIEVFRGFQERSSEFLKVEQAKLSIIFKEDVKVK